MQTQQTASNTHEQLLQELSTMLLQLNTLQTLVRDDAPDINTLRRGLTDLEQRTRSLIAEIRSADEQLPSADLAGTTLPEALTRLVEETAETLGLASRVAFFGDERPPPAYTEKLLYCISPETLYQGQQHNNSRRLGLAFCYGRDEVQ